MEYPKHINLDEKRYIEVNNAEEEAIALKELEALSPAAEPDEETPRRRGRPKKVDE